MLFQTITQAAWPYRPKIPHPGEISGLGMGIGFVVLLAIVWLLPVILILRSEKTNGAEKLVWVLLIFFFSWFSWLLYVLLAPIGQQQR
jgi:uncharacterized protein with PQ loop repeat